MLMELISPARLMSNAKDPVDACKLAANLLRSDAPRDVILSVLESVHSRPTVRFSPPNYDAQYFDEMSMLDQND